MNSFFGENVRRAITEEYKCKSDNWMNRENDERVLDYCRLANGE